MKLFVETNQINQMKQISFGKGLISMSLPTPLFAEMGKCPGNGLTAGKQHRH